MKNTRSKAKQTDEMRYLRTKIKALEKVVLERKRLEKALRDSEKRVRQLSNVTFEAIVIHENGKILEVNQAFCRMFGYDRSDAVGRLATELAAPEYRELVRQKIAAADTKPYKGVALRKDGSAFTVELVGKPIAYHDRTVRVTAIRDISEHKRAEDDLKNLLSQLQATLESTDDAILVVDTESRITNYNKRFLELWHIPKNIMATRNDNTALQYVLKQLKEPEKFLAKVRELYSHPDEASFDVLEFKDGRIFERYSHPQKLDGKSIGRVWSFRDVTERKREERALQESVEQFRDLAEKTPNMIFINQKGRIVYANEKCSEIMGYTSEEFLAPDFDFRRLIAPESLPAVMQKFEDHQKGRDIPPYDYVLITKQGQRLHTIYTTRLITFNGERAILGIITDVTERKRVEVAVAASEASYRGLFNGVGEAIYVQDREGRFLDVNSAAERMYGYSRETLIGKTPLFVSAPGRNDLHKVSEMIERAFAGESQCFEFWGRRANGEIFPKEVRLVRGTYFGQDVIIASADDITERKRADEALRRSEIKYRTIFENVQDVFYQTDKEGRIIDISPSIHRYAGYTREELIGMPALEIYAQPEDQRIFLRELYRKGEAIDHILRLKTKDAQLIYVSANAHLLYDTMRKPCGVEGALRDVTQRKLAEEALRRSEENYRNIIDFAPLGIYQASWEGELITANITLARMLGYDSAAELLEKNLSDDVYYHKGDRDRLIQILQPMGYAADFVVQWKKKDGTPIWIQLDAHGVKDETGETRYFEGFVRDFTERKRAEEVNTLLAQTLKSAQDCISITDLNDKILFVNHAFLATYGYNEEALIGKHIAMVRPASVSRLQVEEILPSTLKGHWHGELVNRRKDGTEFPIELWTSVVIDAEGNPIAAVGVARDITERKRAEEELKRSHEKFKELFDDAPIGYHELDAMGIITNVNLTELRMLGYTSEEMVGRPVWEFFGGGEPSRKRVLDKLAGVLDPNKNAERTYRRKDGTTIPVMVDEGLLRNQRGEVTGMRTVIQDIAEKKQAEGALRQSEEKYRSLFEESKDVVYISTPDGRLVDINPAGVELLGYKSKEEMLPIEIAHGFFADPQQREEMRKLMEDQGFVRNFEEVLRRKDGKKITVLDTATAVRDAKDRTILFRGILRDVTKEKQLEEEITQIQKLESIGTLASGIAHDFNNILGIVLGYSSLIERIADDPEKLSQSVQSINAAVQRGASLVKQILTFARKAEVVFGPIDVNVMIKEIVKMLRETFPKTIEMSLQLNRELPFIIADATQLHQALLNISVNARDAMPNGGILSFKTEVATGSSLRNAFPDVADGDYAHISVTDTGIGMDDATRAHIFDPFFTTKEKGRGTGLGLSVVYGVMKKHNGFIDVQSELGKGTTFDLYFPISEESLCAKGKQAEDIEGIPGGTETILIVEDEEALLTMLKVILEVKGYHALTAVDGLEALALFRKHKDEIALVMSDVGLPKISGDQLYFELKKVKPSVRVVLVSGYLDPGIKSEIFKAGVHDFVQKPYDPNEVLKKVREAIDRK